MTDDTSLSKSDRTTRAILDSAYRLFVSQGYAATSMRQIAEDAGLALGSAYNHFSSKDDIFKTIILKRHPIFVIMPLIKATKGNTIEEFIRNAARTLVAELEQNPEFINLLLIEMVEFKGQHAPLLFERVWPDLLAIAGQVAVFQDELQPIPPPLLLRAFLGMFFSYFITDILLKNLMPAAMQENALDRFVDIFLNGIKQPVDNRKLNTSESL